jgi:hypothetical protein
MSVRRAQRIEDQVRKGNDTFDASARRLAAVRASAGPAQREEPAIVRSNELSPHADGQRGFTTTKSGFHRRLSSVWYRLPRPGCGRRRSSSVVPLPKSGRGVSILVTAAVCVKAARASGVHPRLEGAVSAARAKTGSRLWGV